MGRVNTPQLSQSQREELEALFKNSSNASFRKRCQLILLKGQGRNSKDVGQIIGMSHVSVNSWLKRYKQKGIEGLQIKQGRGRKAIINKEGDHDSILAIVQSERQRLQTAKAEWEALSGKTVSKTTFRRFLKALAEPINVSENDVAKM
jgi:transposase